MKYYIIAGEASGDLHASNLMQSIKEHDKEAEFRFFGGDLMLNQGGVLVKHYREMAFMGFVNVLKNIRTIIKNMNLCKEDIIKYNPDALILVDYPGFNLKIAKAIKKRNPNIPVFYYISPKIWAWKEYRIKDIRKYVDKMLTILPFEEDYFKGLNYRAEYVGNPTVDAIEQWKRDETNDFRQTHKLGTEPIIAILPGSRQQEIKGNLPAMINAVNNINDYQIVIAGAPGINPEFYNSLIIAERVKIVFSNTYSLLNNSEIALVTSGTATLETALLNTPQVVCYRTSLPKISYLAFKHILKIDYISLVNLIAGKEVVKELFAKNFSVENISNECQRILFDPIYREKMKREYQRIREQLGEEGASKRAAKIITESIKS